MFGRRKQEQPQGAPPGMQRRYFAEEISIVVRKGSLVRQVQESLDRGQADGWKLMHVTQSQSIYQPNPGLTVILFWDLRPEEG